MKRFHNKLKQTGEFLAGYKTSVSSVEVLL